MGHKVVVFEAGQSDPKRVLNIVDGDTLRGIQWVDADTVLVTVSAVVRYSNRVNNTVKLFEFYRTIAADIAGGTPRMLLPEGDYLRTNTEVIGTSPARPGSV